MRLKKVSRVIFVILILIFILSMLLWSIPFGRAASKINIENIAALEKGKISNPTLLPGNPFYFLKNWAWGIKKIFTADKINWHLGFAASKLLDIKALSEKKPGSLDRINKAITYYEEASQKSEQFINNSSSDNKKASLEMVVKSLIFYKKVFSSVLSSSVSGEMKIKISILAKEKQEYFMNFLGKSNDFDKILTILNGEISDNKGIFSSLQNLDLEEILKTILSGGTKIISSFQDKLYTRALAAFNNAYWTYGDSLKNVFDVLPGDKKIQRQALWDWNARSGQNELFEKMLGNINESPLNNEEIEECLAGFDVVQKQITAFKNFIGSSKISSNVESFLIMAEGTLKHAQERMNVLENKYACNLIQNSQAMISNAWRLVQFADKVNITTEITEIENQISIVKKTSEKYDQDKNKRLFDLINLMEKQLLSIKSSADVDNFENALQKIDEFGVILNNFNFILDILNGNKIIVQELNIEQDFFNKENLERFINSCSNQEGSLIDGLVILPFCKLKNGEILMMR